LHLQVLSSGSKGNSTLIRAGEVVALVDAGLPLRTLEERLEVAKVSPRSVQHVIVTHAHLDHSRSAGRLARKAKATIHAAERNLDHRALTRAPAYAVLPINGQRELTDPKGNDILVLGAARIPHDADPTVAIRLEHEGRCAVVLTDMGRVDDGAARHMRGAHVLVLEFNHDEEMLRLGPYPQKLIDRVRGDGGHLSNSEAAEMLGLLIGPELHTLVLAHLSEKNNTPELARQVAEDALAALGRGDVKVLIAAQGEVGPNIEV
jgi:phosphoribosyl 1,2-cyclic phosphodiesterase